MQRSRAGARRNSSAGGFPARSASASRTISVPRADARTDSTMAQFEALVVNMLEQGFLFSFLGLGVLLTFRFFRFPDLTAEGSYPLGGAVAATLLVGGMNPFLATGIAVLAGAAAGAVTALVHTKLKINNI